MRRLAFTTAALALLAAPPAAGAPVGVDVDRPRFSPLVRSQGGGVTGITVRSDARRIVHVFVTGAGGRRLRTISAGELGPGPDRTAWDGRDDAGVVVRDGSYEVVAASPDGSGAAVRVTVDSRAPGLRLARSRITPPHPRPRRAAVPLLLSERSTIRFRRRGIVIGRAARGPGAHRVAVPVPFALRGRGRAERPIPLRLGITVTDRAGNERRLRRVLRLTPPGSRTGDDPRAGRERLSWPVWGEVTSYYGPRGGRAHEGIDIDADTGEVIGAAADGRVVFAGSDAGYGLLVVVAHGNGLRTAYAHQSLVAVRRGQSVVRGQRIGHIGSTGHSTGSHLHFEVRRRGRAEDPVRLLSLGRAGMPRSPFYFP